MIWLQERDDKRLFKAELCPTDLLPEFRRRFLPWQLEPGCRPTDDDIEGYKIECTLAQLPDVQMEAADQCLTTQAERNAFRAR